jgi:regulator of sigma E protease
MGSTVMPKPVIERYTNPFSAAGFAVAETFDQASNILSTLVALVTGQLSLKALGGPILIAKIAGDSAKAGWVTFFSSMALISINLGLVNLFPIPVLDGGQIVLLGAEAIKRGPLSDKTLENFQKVGFILVMSLVLLAVYNDLSRFWKSMVKSLAGLF